MTRVNTTTITSELTGTESVYPVAEAPVAVTVTLAHKNGSKSEGIATGDRDLTADEITALAAWVTTGDTAPLFALLRPLITAPATASKSKSKSKGAGSASGSVAVDNIAGIKSWLEANDHTSDKIREWANAHGRNEKSGRMRNDTYSAYASAHGYRATPATPVTPEAATATPETATPAAA